jgi:hypothetical protein
MMWIRSMWLRIGNGDSEHGNEPEASVKDKEFLDQLRKYYLLKKDCAAWS